MIVRTWTGRTHPGDAAAYRQLLREEILPRIATETGDGYRGHEVAKRELDDGERTEFLTLLRFDSYDAVRRFAGDDYEVAHVPPEARELLADYDDRAEQYEVVASDRG